jgi:tRNA-dihydrouridine synthase
MIDNVLSFCRPFALDINMGCPVWWMRRLGAGAGLLSEPSRAFSVVESARKTWKGPLFVKIRAGTTAIDISWLLDFCQGLVDSGADVITLHGRTVEERLRREARWDLVLAVREALLVPVIGNGDVRSADQAIRRLQETGAGGIMIGRGVLMDPFVFSRASASLQGRPFKEPTYEDEVSIRLELIDDIAATYEPGRAACRIRKLLPYLLCRFPFARRCALEIGRLKTPAAQRVALHGFLEKFSGQATQVLG